MRVRSIGALAAFLFLLLVACSSTTDGSSSSSSGESGKKYCAKGAHSCRCQNTAFTLEGDETTVTSCPAAEYACCYDLDTDGLTTSCDCLSYLCSTTDTRCDCFWTKRITGREEVT